MKSKEASIFMIAKINAEYKLANLKPMLGKFTLSSSDIVLDAGCGYGVRSIELGRDVGARVISVDISSDCLKSLKQKKGEFDIDIIRADLQNIPLKDNSVDRIVSGDVLEHIPNVFKALDSFHRITKKTGLIFLLVPSSVSEKLLLRLDTTYAKRIGHLRIFESIQFQNLVNSVGFHVIDSYRVGFFRAFYHLFQVLSGSRIEHQTGRVIADNSGLSIFFRISRLLFYSWMGDLIEVFGNFIFPSSFVIIAAKNI